MNLKINKNGHVIIKSRKEEIWRKIKYAERKGITYEVVPGGKIKSVYVSNYGRFKQITITGKVRITNGSKRDDNNGKTYMHIALSFLDDGLRVCKSFKCHRLVAYAFLGNPPSPEYVPNHKDDNGTNNYIDNLEWVTKQRNSELAIKTGAREIIMGDKHYKSKISESLVLNEICPRLLSGYSNKEISEYIKSLDYECSKETISAIRNKYNWKSIVKDYDFPKDKGFSSVRCKCPDELIHNICILIQKGKIDIEIVNELGLSIVKEPTEYVHKIRIKKLKKHISNLYF